MSNVEKEIRELKLAVGALIEYLNVEVVIEERAKVIPKLPQLQEYKN